MCLSSTQPSTRIVSTLIHKFPIVEVTYDCGIVGEISKNMEGLREKLRKSGYIDEHLRKDSSLEGIQHRLHKTTEEHKVRSAFLTNEELDKYIRNENLQNIQDN